MAAGGGRVKANSDLAAAGAVLVADFGGALDADIVVANGVIFDCRYLSRKWMTLAFHSGLMD